MWRSRPAGLVGSSHTAASSSGLSHLPLESWTIRASHKCGRGLAGCDRIVASTWRVEVGSGRSSG